MIIRYGIKIGAVKMILPNPHMYLRQIRTVEELEKNDELPILAYTGLRVGNFVHLKTPILILKNIKFA